MCQNNTSQVVEICQIADISTNTVLSTDCKCRRKCVLKGLSKICPFVCPFIRHRVKGMGFGFMFTRQTPQLLVQTYIIIDLKKQSFCLSLSSSYFCTCSAVVMTQYFYVSMFVYVFFSLFISTSIVDESFHRMKM